MKSIRALRRLLANTDRVNDLLAATERMRETVDNDLLAATERMRETVDNLGDRIVERLDRLNQAIDNQSAVTNQRLEAIVNSITNQATAVNLRLDRITAAITRDDDLAGSGRSREEGGAPGRAQINKSARTGLSAEWLNAPSPRPLPLPRWSASVLPKGLAEEVRIGAATNALRQHQPLLDALQPWQGAVPKGYGVDFLGILTDGHFRTLFGVDPDKTGGAYTRTEIPSMGGDNGEWWFETINWLAAAREARDRYVMVTLGASYGAQAVGAYRALQIVNPLPCKLVAVEPVPENCLWVRKHFRDNGIDPDAHWLINAAISDRNDPVLFPIGGAGSGANNCMSTDTPAERQILAEQLINEGKAADTLRSLMINNTTGVVKDLLPGQGITGEIELVSSVSLRDVLSPFDLVDYLEADIQQSEVRVFPPFHDLLKRKVRRIHIGTHGAENHALLHDLFAKGGWEIVFDYAPNATYQSDIGPFELNDGVLTVRNPEL